MEFGKCKKCFGWHELANGDVIHYYFEGGSLQEIEFLRDKNNKARKQYERGLVGIMLKVRLEVLNFINIWSGK